MTSVNGYQLPEIDEGRYRRAVFLDQAYLAFWIALVIAILCVVQGLLVPHWSLAIQAIAFGLAAAIDRWCWHRGHQHYRLGLARLNLSTFLTLSGVAIALTSDRLVLAAAMVIIFLVLASSYFESPRGTLVWGVVGTAVFLGSVALREVLPLPPLQMPLVEPILYYTMPSLIMLLAGLYAQQVNGYLRQANDELWQANSALARAYAELEATSAARAQEAAERARIEAEALRAEERAIVAERTRIAREMHDRLGQLLMALHMNIAVARVHLPDNQAQIAAALASAQRETEAVTAEVRRAIAALRAAATEEQPFLDALRTLAQSMGEFGPPVRLMIHGAVRSLPTRTTTALYHIAQEALTNVQKHAHATQATIQLDYRVADQVQLVIEDDGRGTAGIDDRSQDEGGRYGLRGIQERVAQLGGTLTLTTAQGAGFRITVEIPA